MSRTFKFAVVLVTVIAVATVLIAPTIDMPGTTLREHSVSSSHGSGEHLHGGFLIVSSASLSNWHAFEGEKHGPPDVESSDRTRVPAATVLRC